MVNTINSTSLVSSEVKESLNGVAALCLLAEIHDSGNEHVSEYLHSAMDSMGIECALCKRTGLE